MPEPDNDTGPHRQDWLLWPVIALGIVILILYFVNSEGLKPFM